MLLCYSSSLCFYVDLLSTNSDPAINDRCADLLRILSFLLTALNRSRLTRQTHICNRQMSKEKSAHYSKGIAEHFGDYGSLWKAFNKILHCCPKIHLPDRSSIATLAHTFSSFVINKISVIRSSLPYDSHSRVLNPPDTRKVLQNLSCASAHVSPPPFEKTRPQ